MYLVFLREKKEYGSVHETPHGRGYSFGFHRSARQWGNALHFVGMKCFSRHTFAAATTPIDSTLLCIYVSGNHSGAHDWPQPTQRGGPTPSSSISVCTRLVEAQLPSNRRRAKLSPLYPGMVTVAPGGVPATLLYSVVCS